METIIDFIKKYINGDAIPSFTIIDVVEIIILAFLSYRIMVWIKHTRAWALLKGILILLVFILAAYLFKMNTIIWLIDKFLNVALLALVVVFQPEMRKALEHIGSKGVMSGLLSISGNRSRGRIDFPKVVNEITKACFEMSKEKTGALIVIEGFTTLAEYERTGIPIDGVVSSQLLLNIFEHNTPLHDGAVIIRDNRVIAATCYLPISDSMSISKALGTRHRAAVGISEITDSTTVIVSEETGHVSIARDGELMTIENSQMLKEELLKQAANANEEKNNHKFFRRKQNERKANE